VIVDKHPHDVLIFFASRPRQAAALSHRSPGKHELKTVIPLDTGDVLSGLMSYHDIQNSGNSNNSNNSRLDFSLESHKLISTVAIQSQRAW